MHALLLMTALLLAPLGAPATPPDAELCLTCHADPQLTLTAGDGTLISMHVDETAFGRSVHAKLACADCHAGDDRGAARHARGAVAPRAPRHLQRGLPALSFLDLYEDTRQRAPGGGGARRPHGACVRGLPRLARDPAARSAAHEHL